MTISHADLSAAMDRSIDADAAAGIIAGAAADLAADKIYDEYRNLLAAYDLQEESLALSLGADHPATAAAERAEASRGEN